MINRLRPKEIKPERERLWKEQSGICPLCQDYINPEDAVLDHNHKTGYIRHVLHRNCNLFLGKIENNIPRNKLTATQAQNLLLNAWTYMQTKQLMIHPTHLTPEEKLKRAMNRRRKRKVINTKPSKIKEINR